MISTLVFGLLLQVTRQTADATASVDPERVVFHVVTIGPGIDAFAVFGHIGLWVENRATAENKVYNWGAFRFDSPWLVPNFFLGRFQYWMAVTDYFDTLESYRAQGREIVAQELALTTPQKARLLALLAENEKPENIAFRYDYYRDNCSTRIRDLLDAATDGALRRSATQRAQWSLREHTQRLTAGIWWEHVGLDFVTTAPVDAPATEWDEMFVPDKLREVLQRATNDGQPFVKRRLLLSAGTVPPSLQAPPQHFHWLGIVGVCTGAAAYILRRVRWITVSLSMFIGFFALLALALWAGTDHEAMYANENLFVVSPLVLCLTPALVTRKAGPIARGASLLLILSIASGWCCKIFPSFTQVNWRILVLATPSVLALAYTVLRLPRDHQN